MVLTKPCPGGGLAPSRGPCAMAFGPLLEGRETGLANGIPVRYLVLFQQLDATLSDLDWRGARGDAVHGRWMSELFRESR